MSRRNTSGRCARSGSIQVCCRTKPGTRSAGVQHTHSVVPAKAGTYTPRPFIRAEWETPFAAISAGGYGSRFRGDDGLFWFTASLLRRLLRDGGFGAGDRGAAHVAGLRLVVAADPVHGLAVVPHHEIMQRPFVDVDEFALR